MKCSIAVLLVIVALSSAEPQRNGRVQAQPPYQPRGFRPAGPAFSLPLKSQQQQLPPTPAASYGPPTQEYGPPAEEATTTEAAPTTTTETIETTTLEQQAENFRVAPVSQKLQEAPANPAGLYVVVPQADSFFYAPIQGASAKLVAQPQQPRLVPVQAVPAFAKIQEVPRFAQIVDYQGVASGAALPVVSSAYTSIVNTPYSSSFVQSFQ
ncbi:hypothetical protein YQE_06851, partial [Dendroctonus ponderosae]